VRKDIGTTVGTNDALGLKDPNHFITLQAAGPREFAFRQSADKMEAFMAWLQEQVDRDILEVEYGAGQAIVGYEGWQDVYITRSYKKGMKRAQDELVKAGAAVPISDSALQAAFFAPIHADRVGMLFARNFRELKGITEAMDQAISRSLAESIAEGRGPMQAARILQKRVGAIGINRARTMARTEIIRAHHSAMINTYRSAGIEGVIIRAEWRTAGDFRVCEECEALEGEVFTLDEIENMIPLHPNCRCIALPYLPTPEEELEFQMEELEGLFEPDELEFLI